MHRRRPGPVAGGSFRLPALPGGGGEEAANTAGRLQNKALHQEVSADHANDRRQIEEVRTDDAANEIYVADSAFGGRVMVFSLDKFEFKRGWGAYGHKLSEISTDPAAHAYNPGGPMAKEFVGHLTFTFSNDGLVYAADRAGNRITSPTSRAISSRRSSWPKTPAWADPPAELCSPNG